MPVQLEGYFEVRITVGGSFGQDIVEKKTKLGHTRDWKILWIWKWRVSYPEKASRRRRRRPPSSRGPGCPPSGPAQSTRPIHLKPSLSVTSSYSIHRVVYVKGEQTDSSTVFPVGTPWKTTLTRIRGTSPRETG